MKKKIIVIAIVVITSLLILVFILFNSNNALLLLSNKNIRTTEPDAYELEVEEKDTINFVDSSLGTVTNYTGGNSNHDQLAYKYLNDGYVKELLTLYFENEQGLLDPTKRKAYAPALTVLGINSNEAGLYPGTYIPLSYLPFDRDSKTVLWNTPYKGLSEYAMTLKGFGANELKTLGDINEIAKGPAYGMLQYEIKSAKELKANIDGASNSDRKVGSIHYLPDTLVWVNTRMAAMIDIGSLNEKEFSETPGYVRAGMLSTAHNRGDSGLYQQVYGIAYNRGMDGRLNAKLASTSENLEVLGGLATASNNFYLSNPDFSFDGLTDAPGTRAIAACLGLHEGWYFADGIMDNVNDKMLTVWNRMYPKEKLTLDELRTKFRQRTTKSLATVIQETHSVTLTSEQTYKIYGTRNNYKDAPYYTDGYKKHKTFMFKVYNKTSAVYTNKLPNGDNPPVVSAYDYTSAGHLISSVLVPTIIMDWLLNYSNLDREATAVRWIHSHLPVGVKLSTYGYEPSRAKVLNAAQNWVNITYLLGGNSKQSIDCSAFVYRVYQDAGYDIEYQNTGGMINSKYWEWIPLSEAQPGDIIVRRNGITDKGHTAILLDIDMSTEKVTIIEAQGKEVKSGIYQRHTLTKNNYYRGDTKPTNMKDNSYYVFKHVDTTDYSSALINQLESYK